jgi:2,4-dienoyl-CoA reductase (NADPH2)
MILSPRLSRILLNYNTHARQESHHRLLSTSISASDSPHQQQQQQHAKYPKLFSSLDLGPDIGVLPNRVLMGSMHSGLEGHSLPSLIHAPQSLDRMAAYFRERAQGEAGLMVTGGIAPNAQGWTGPFSSQLVSTAEMERHHVVTEAVHSVQIPMQAGDNKSSTKSTAARICLQILHTGRYSYTPLAVSASRTKSPISPFMARAMSVNQIENTTQDFVRTAVLAKEAGYDGVEIMASEGYLLSQFLSPRTNQRKDQYGGPDMYNRARFPLDIVRETRKAVGKDFIIIFRLSLLDLVQDGLLFEESAQLAKELQNAGVTILNTGIGWHEARVPTISTLVPRAAFAFPTIQLKKLQAVSLPLVATNRINDPVTAEQVLQQGADMVSMARPFLADAAIVKKSRLGQEDEINTCIACNQACLDHVFVGKTASCLVNPRACHETELSLDPLPQKDCLNIGVIGSGPAGCAFAITAAQIGHKVTLFDQDDKIGGQFNMAKRVPGKEEFYETLRYFDTMLKKHNVNVQLQTSMSLERMKAANMDKWIVATGVNPRDPKIPGQEHPNVLSYIQVLKEKLPVGKRVAVIGAGGIGFDVSEYLLYHDGKKDKTAKDVSCQEFWKEWGIDATLQTRGGLVSAKPHQSQRQVYLLQRKKGKVGANLGKTTGWIHRASLLNTGAVEMVGNVRYDKIDENGHLHITIGDKSRVLEVDNVVICAGQVEKSDLEQAAASDMDLKQRVYSIGGAYQAGELDAKRAIDMGTRLALKIHHPEVVPGQHVFTSEPNVEEAMFKMLKRFM